jgi:hypothetical protein
MSKFYKWLKSDTLYNSKGRIDQPIWWYLIGTGIQSNTGWAIAVGWVFGGSRGEGPLGFDKKLLKLKVVQPKDHQRFEKRMITDVFERGKTLWPEGIRSIKYER